MISRRFKKACYEFAKRASIEDISNIILFGSVARGEAKKGSDIDLLILGEEEAREKVSEIALDIEKEYDISLQLVSENSLEDLDPYFIKEILKEGIVLYGNLAVKFKKLNLKPYSIISYSLKNLEHSEKMKLRRNLYGYSTKKKYKNKIYESSSKGLLKRIGGEKLGPSVLLVPRGKINLLEKRFEKFGIDYEKKDVYLSLV